MGVLRFLLAISVVVFHSRPFIANLTFVPGFTAVQLFFIISGFYMSLILNEKYTRKRDFYRARLLKIFPLYWAAMVAGILIIGYFPPWNSFRAGSIPLKEFLYLTWANFFIFGSELVAILRVSEGGSFHFIGLSEPQDLSMWSYLLIGPVWSLSLELYYYLLAPFLVRLDRLLPLRLAVVFGIDLVIRTYLIHNQILPVPWCYNLLPSALPYFLLGSVSYAIYARFARNQPRSKIIGSIGLITLALSFILTGLLPSPDNWELELGFLRFPATGLLFVGVTCLTPFIFEFTKKSRIDRFIGEISYPIYATHWIFANYSPQPSGMHPIIPTIGLSLLLHWAVTRPMEKFRHRKSDGGMTSAKIIEWPNPPGKKAVGA